MNWGPRVTLQDAAGATGDGIALAVNSRGAVNIAISGTFSGTVTFEASDDGTTFYAVPALNRTTGVSATTTTAAGLYYIALPGIYFVRARVSTWASGTITAVAVPVDMMSPPTEASDSAANAVLGTTAGSAVVTDANGTIQQYLRGIVKLIVAKLSVYITGAANVAITQVTAGAASGVLVATRATRRTITIRNQDAANSVYIGTGTVTSGNGFLLKFGESISIDTVAALNCIRDTGDVALGVIEIYD